MIVNSLKTTIFVRSSVKILTLSVLCFMTAGCSYLKNHYGERCKSHAYVREPLLDYITNRFHRNSPVRLGILPFSVPANLTSSRTIPMGLENRLAQDLHDELLNFKTIPIVEVLPREDWPGKRDEFGTGNFTALKMGRDAGYDLILVGILEPITSLDRLTIYTKLLDADNGVTIWYGKSTVSSDRGYVDSLEVHTGIKNARPAELYTEPIIRELSECAADAIMKDE